MTSLFFMWKSWRITLRRRKKMREDGKADHVQAMETLKNCEAQAESTSFVLKQICEAAQPIADMIEPPVEGVEPCPLSEILKDVPDKLSSYIQKMAKSISQQVLSFVKSFYSKANLALLLSV